MSYSNYTEELLGIQDIQQLNVETKDGIKYIHILHKRKIHVCPCCHTKTNKVHDYRTQYVKDLSCFDYRTVLVIRKRRYACDGCGRRFYEKTPYLPRYAHMTQRMVFKILEQLADTRTFTNIAQEHHVSVNTVIRVFNHIQYPTHPQLPEVFSIDEFKGNTGGEKYNCIIADPKTHVVLDILPKRYEKDVQSYLLSYPREERAKTRIFISDMWKPYQSSGDTAFKKARLVIDKYHWIRTVVWAFERVRKDVQRHLSKDLRTVYKHSRRLLLKSYDYLTLEEQNQVNMMRTFNNDIYFAHILKEQFWHILQSENRQQAKELMNEWIENARSSGIAHMRDCANTLEHWKPEILNSFTTPYTNGYIEGCNNKIKVLKRTAYGYRNFKRFRNRILYIFSNNPTA